jgi:hypothetical protein
MAVVSRMNSELMAHAATLTFEDFPKLRIELSSLLRKNGAAVTLIEKDLDLKALPDFSAEGPNIAIKDFSSLQRKHQIDKLLVINITMIGFERTYSAYTPTSPPKGVFQGLGYIVNLKTNSYDWYLPVRVIKSSEMTWDEPPNFPGLTNAYFQSLEIGKDQFLQPFADSVKTREKVAVAPPSPVTANMMPTPVMSTTKTTQ